MNFELIYLLVFYRYRPSQIRSVDDVVEAAPGWLIFRPKVGADLRSPEKAKGGVIADSPFVHYSRMLNLELISPVQIAG
jgi:hypothetical protein